jgi:hypothetical protein
LRALPQGKLLFYVSSPLNTISNMVNDDGRVLGHDQAQQAGPEVDGMAYKETSHLICCAKWRV